MREEWLDKEKRYELRHELSEQMQNPQGKDTSECFSGECWNEQEKYGTITDRSQIEKMDKKDERK